MKEIERTCIVCRKKDKQENFDRIVLNKNGELAVQSSKKLDGRGAYVCKTNECYDKLLKTRALNRAFKQNFSEVKYQQIINILKN